MKKILVLLFIVIFLVNICSCSQNGESKNNKKTSSINNTEKDTIISHDKEINGYKYAEFNKYNSKASINGLKGDKVFVDGKMTDINSKDVSDSGYEGGEYEVYYGELTASDGVWNILLTSADKYDFIDIMDKFYYKTGVVYGEYLGYSDVLKSPMILLHKYEVDGKIVFDNTKDDSNNEDDNDNNSDVDSYVDNGDTTDEITKIYSDKKFTIYFEGLKPESIYSSNTDVVFLVENHTKEQITFYADTIVINGFSYNDIIMADEVAQKSKGRIRGTIEEELDLDNVRTISANLTYSKSNDLGNGGTIKIKEKTIK